MGLGQDGDLAAVSAYPCTQATEAQREQTVAAEDPLVQFQASCLRC